MHPTWTFHLPDVSLDTLGFIPIFLSLNNPNSARLQIDENYQHGGGWRPLPKFKLLDDNSLKYPGDPKMKPLASCTLRNETIVFYDGAFVAIIQPDRSFEAARID